MSKAAFVTSFQGEIPLESDYGARIGKYVRADSPDHLYDVQYTEKAPPIGLGMFAYKHYEGCMIFDALRRQGVGLDFKSMLDIGSGFAAVPRIVYVRNHAEDVTAMDLFPYGVDALTNGAARRMLAALWLAQKTGRGNVRGPMGKWEWVVGKENFTLPPLGATGRFRYEVGDVYDHDGAYDWINSSLTLTHFDHRKLFPKIAELLVDGGIFTFTVECWWYPINSTQIVGDAPYMCQRLTRDDLLRYFAESHPDQDKEKVAAVYDYYADPSHPTASTYVETAAAHGLHPIVVDRHMNARPHNKRAGITPPYLGRETGQEPRDALRDIHRFQDEVLLEDLYASHYLMGFKKVARTGA